MKLTPDFSLLDAVPWAGHWVLFLSLSLSSLPAISRLGFNRVVAHSEAESSDYVSGGRSLRGLLS